MLAEEQMCDSTDDQGLDCKEVSLKKLCVDCGTSKTPLWRRGPAGPKSLCNACGIRSRKKRRALLGLAKSDEKKKEKDKKKSKHMMNNINIINERKNRSSCCCSSSNCYSDSMFMCDILKPPNVRIEELNEEQQAAVLLMALSHGFNS
uniref:GATA-type domain-containing protein n=1 Tax=Kalanchoe fedtschenkoi TaxID=63787 RepID=A0A7N0U3C2_KALFE